MMKPIVIPTGMTAEEIEALDGHALDACGVALWMAAVLRVTGAMVNVGRALMYIE